MIRSVYKNIITNYSKLTLLVLVLILSTFVYFSKDFKLDASSDTLLLENDPDLKYLREVNSRYGSKDFLVLTYTPKEDLLNETTIENLTDLKNDLSNLSWVNNVLTILDVPLLKITKILLLKELKISKRYPVKMLIKKEVLKKLSIAQFIKNLSLAMMVKPPEY